MANDITTAISGIAINNIASICSTLQTGKSSKLLSVSNYPANRSISNIQSKFDNRFDDPSYYYGNAVASG